MDVEFSGEVWHWRGPAPFYFLTVPPPQAQEIHDIASTVTYGWGMIPVNARIGETEWYTALWPKDGLYVLPLEAAVRKRERIGEGDCVSATVRPIRR